MLPPSRFAHRRSCSQFFVAVFALEMVIKMTAQGIWARKGAYLRDSVSAALRERSVR